LLIADLQHRLAELFAKGPLVEHELDIKSRGKAGFNRCNLLITETLGAKLAMVEGRAVLQGAEAYCVVDDLLNLRGIVTQSAKRFRNCLVDDLEITTTSQFLEFHQSKIRFNSRGIAIHDQAD